MSENFFSKIPASFAAFRKKLSARELAAAIGEIEETLRSSVANHPLPLCLVTGDGRISFANDSFRTAFPKLKILASTAKSLFGEDVAQALARGDEEISVSAGGREFRVLGNFQSGATKKSKLLYFIDETEANAAKRLYEEEKLCYCYLSVDNYEEVLQASPDDTRSIRAAAIDSLIRKFAEALEGSLLRYRDGSYQIVFKRKYYEGLSEKKFEILDAARKLETDADFPTSFSLGIGLDGASPAEMNADALYALDLARGRGGDQAVVKNASTVEYFGGTVQVIENRSKGKSRVMSHAIRQLIGDSENVLVMGHRNPDIDSLGAACAISRMANRHGRESFVVLGDLPPSLAEVFNLAQETGNYKFISGEDAEKKIGQGTLLVVIDTHIPDMVDYPALLGKTEKLLVIDHHRKRESIIEGATLMYMEPNASSTSELVTELLQFDEEFRKIDKFEAEMLLGGIFIDTNNFSIKTGSRTFEAAAWLRRNGAETTNVRGWLQSNMEDFRQRASITANAEFSKTGVAISKSDGKHSNAQIVAAQSADELLDIKGVKASFVVGATNHEVIISARSLGELNVQRIMERFGGGGHLTMAAAQIKGGDINDIIKRLKKYIKEAEGESK